MYFYYFYHNLYKYLKKNILTAISHHHIESNVKLIPNLYLLTTLTALQAKSGIFYHGVRKNLDLSGESV